MIKIACGFFFKICILTYFFFCLLSNWRRYCFIATVIKSRTEGQGLNATCRTFDIAKNTLLDWERKLASLKDTFLLYALLHTFLKQEIEGDELYTKVKEKVPVEDCEGWTIVLMDRASRFIWVLDCGKKDQELFLGAMQIFKELIEQRYYLVNRW